MGIGKRLMQGGMVKSLGCYISILLNCCVEQNLCSGEEELYTFRGCKSML